jgi:hypothetical protein
MGLQKNLCHWPGQGKDCGSGMRGVADDGTHGRLNHQAPPRSRDGRVTVVALEEKTTMESCYHWLTELGEVYARHAGRHGPHRLLPAEVLPPHGLVPEPAEPSPQDSGPNGRTVEPSAPRACTRI